MKKTQILICICCKNDIALYIQYNKQFLKYKTMLLIDILLAFTTVIRKLKLILARFRVI